MADPSEQAGSVEGVGRHKFGRALFGYRRGEVDAALAALEGALERLGEQLRDAERRAGALQRERDELDRVANALAERVVARDRELRGLRAELQRARGETRELLRSLGALAGEVEQMREQARAQATRIRLSALREAADVAPGHSQRGTAPSDGPAPVPPAAVPAPAAPAGHSAPAAPGAVPAAVPPAPPGGSAAPGQMAPAPPPASAAASTHAAAPAPAPPGAPPAPATPATPPPPTPAGVGAPAPPGGEGDDPGRAGAAPVGAYNGARTDVDPSTLFDGLVELEVGPLEDFSQLVGFEDAVGSISAAVETTVKRFAKGRATLELRLGWPVALVRELEQRAPFPFAIRDLDPARVVLDVTGER